MKKTLVVIIYFLIIFEAITVVYLGFRAYFVFSFNQQNLLVDGFGRMVYKSPWWLKLVTREDDWPGLKWFVFDIVFFWISFGVGYLLLLLGNKISDSIDE